MKSILFSCSGELRFSLDIMIPFFGKNITLLLYRIFCDNAISIAEKSSGNFSLSIFSPIGAIDVLIDADTLVLTISGNYFSR